MIPSSSDHFVHLQSQLIFTSNPPSVNEVDQLPSTVNDASDSTVHDTDDYHQDNELPNVKRPCLSDGIVSFTPNHQSPSLIASVPETAKFVSGLGTNELDVSKKRKRCSRKVDHTPELDLNQKSIEENYQELFG